MVSGLILSSFKLDLLKIISGLLVLAALSSWLNNRFLHLPSSIGMMLLGLGLGLGIQITGIFSPEFEQWTVGILAKINFSKILLDFMLSFILFAGALHIDLDKLKDYRVAIFTFATLGVVLCAFFIASSLFLILKMNSLQIPYLHCLLFGALISPTDPIAVLGIVRESALPEKLEIKITGESLFNDGVGIVLFITLSEIAHRGLENTSIQDTVKLLVTETGGGVLFGLLLGYAGYLLIRSINYYQTEVLITLAMVCGGYAFALFMHFSGPLTMALAGLIIGNKAREWAMSKVTIDYTNKFWEMVDDILNTFLFLLIGLELILIKPHWQYLTLGVIIFIVLLGARYLSLFLPTIILGLKQTFEKNALIILTWGGLRGGISIALALSLPPETNRDFFVPLTYIIVLCSITFQGLSIRKVIKFFKQKNKPQ